MQAIDELVAEGISGKKPPAVFAAAFSPELQSPEDLLRQFIRDGRDSLIDAAIAERLLSRAAEFEQTPRLAYNVVKRTPTKQNKSPAEQMDLVFSDASTENPF